MFIWEENGVLVQRINAAIKSQGLNRESLTERIISELVPDSANREFFKQEFRENRSFLLEKFYNDPSKAFPYPTDLNDVLRCILKTLLSEKAYKRVLKKVGRHNLTSEDELLCYDPAKNGQNILKHGIPFQAVRSYFGGHMPLITVNRGENQVLFSRYYYQGGNHKFIYEYQPDREYDFTATVFTMTPEGRMRFITSRVIDLEGDIDRQLEMLISESKLDLKELVYLRKRALAVLRASTQYGNTSYI